MGSCDVEVYRRSETAGSDKSVRKQLNWTGTGSNHLKPGYCLQLCRRGGAFTSQFAARVLCGLAFGLLLIDQGGFPSEPWVIHSNPTLYISLIALYITYIIIYMIYLYIIDML